MSHEIPEKKCWKWLEVGPWQFIRKHAVAREIWGHAPSGKKFRSLLRTIKLLKSFVQFHEYSDSNG